MYRGAKFAGQGQLQWVAYTLSACDEWCSRFYGMAARQDLPGMIEISGREEKTLMLFAVGDIQTVWNSICGVHTPAWETAGVGGCK